MLFSIRILDTCHCLMTAKYSIAWIFHNLLNQFPFSGVFNTTFSEDLISETQKTKLLCFFYN